jgi:hypothetical protein
MKELEACLEFYVSIHRWDQPTPVLLPTFECYVSPRLPRSPAAAVVVVGVLGPGLFKGHGSYLPPLGHTQLAHTAGGW